MRYNRKLFFLLIAAFSVSYVQGCVDKNSQDSKKGSPAKKNNSAVAANHDDAMVVDFSGLKELKGSGTWSNVVILNFDGAKVSAEDSFIVKNSGKNAVAIPSFDVSDLGVKDLDRGRAINQIADSVAAIFQDFEVSFAVANSAADQSSGTVIHIGGADFRTARPALGVAPLDINNFTGKDIGFAFPKTLNKSRGEDNISILSHAIAHEIGHALGASHIIHDQALMNPIVDVESQLLAKGAKATGGGSEDTREILKTNIGLLTQKDTTALPLLKGVTFEQQGDVRQYTIYNGQNTRANPKLNLGLYRYDWTIGTLKAQGSNIRVPLNQLGDSITITVSNQNDSSTVTFPVVTD